MWGVVFSGRKKGESEFGFLTVSVTFQNQDWKVVTRIDCDENHTLPVALILKNQ